VDCSCSGWKILSPSNNQSYGQHQHLIYEYIQQALKPPKYIQRQLLTHQQN
jgi:hypothetical protein